MTRGEVKERAVKGVASLFARQVVVRALGFIGTLVLARVLTPEIFGVFAIMQFVVLFFEQVSSMGLAAALVRRKHAVTEVELSTVFTVQQCAVGLSMLVMLASAPAIAAHYELDPGSEWLIRVVAIGLFLASLKTIPTVLLERRLRHDLVAASEVGEYLAYLLTAISLAVAGFGIWSLVVAVLARGLTGVAILFSIAWWRPHWAIHFATLKEMLRFGVPVQASSLVGLANNAVVPVLVGSVLGVPAVGFVNLARSLVDAAVFQPLILMGRVQLRVFARFQDNPVQLEDALSRSSFAGAAFVCLLAALLVSQSEALITYWATDKWAPMLPLLYVLGPLSLLHAILQPLTQMLKAVGDARTPLVSALLLLLGQTATFLLAGKSLGLTGYAVSVAVGLGLGASYTCARARRFVPLRAVAPVLAPLVAAALAAGAAFAVNRQLAGIQGVLASFIACCAGYIVVLLLLSGGRLHREATGLLGAMAPSSWAARGLAGILGVLPRWKIT